MSDIKIDAGVFSKRVRAFQKAIATKKPILNGASSILIIIGKPDEDYRKSSVVHTWLLGYEFPTTALLITKDESIFITSTSKGKFSLISFI